MKSSEEVNMKLGQKSAPSNKIKKRRKLRTISSSPCENHENESQNDCVAPDAKLGLQEPTLDNPESNKQIEPTNTAKKRGRKSNKDKLQLNLGRNQSDLQTFVQTKAKQSKEIKVRIDVPHESEEENFLSENHIKSRKNHKRKNIKSQEETRDEGNTLNSTPNHSVKDNVESNLITEQKNAFEVMMVSRNKVIGRNSPGKDPEALEANTSIAESKIKLSARKSLLQEWANAKGGLKRKLDDAEKQLCINVKLEMRAKRMKNMLSLPLTNKNKDGVAPSKRKKGKKIIPDSESSSDEALKVIHISEDSEDCESGTEKQVNVFKIKMFSPEVFKRRRRDNTNDNLQNCKATGNKTVSGDHKNRKITNTVHEQEEGIDGEETNLRKSLRKSTKVINYSCSDLISVTSDTEEFSDGCTIDKPKIKESRKSRDMKLAPVFLRATPKPKIDPAIIEARKQFLMSGVPNSLKRIIEKQQTLNDVEYDVFPTVSHVQQKTSCDQKLTDYWSLPPAELCCVENEGFSPSLKEVSLRFLLDYAHDSRAPTNSITEIKNLKSTLKEIKLKNPNFPVFRTYRLLREKVELCHEASRTEKTSIKKKHGQKRKPAQLDDDKRIKNVDILWTDKFKARTSDDIIGNHIGALKLKKWLHSWVEYSQENRLHKTNNSSSSEFDSSDGESSNSRRIPSNAVTVVGPHGSGKTMSIYAVCNELCVNVLELNASDKRTGKRLIQKLQEATQSHQVGKNESTKSSQDDKGQRSSKEKMCLLVVDDIDVVFDEDEGFLSALGQLLSTSKRPIVLVTTDENCGHLQKFLAHYPVIRFGALSANALSVWLQVLCLIEDVKIDEAVLAELLEWNKGDVRRTLLQLQFCMQNTDRKPVTLKNSTESSDVIKLSSDETSNLNVDLQEVALRSNSRQFFINELKLEYIWWNLPSLLSVPPISHNFSAGVDQTKDESEEFYKLQKCIEVFSTLAMSDSIYTKLNIDSSKEPCPKFFQHDIIKDGMELGENVSAYTECKEFAADWTNYLLSKQLDVHGEPQIKMTCLTGQERSWRSKRYNCERKFLELVSPSYYTDRKAFALDYFPVLRTIARSEKQRSITNCKRRNRFYNYLCTLGFNQKDATSQTACDILNTSDDNK